MTDHDLSKLNPPETAPKDGRQILAWAIDQHGNGYGEPADHPRWCVVQWADDLGHPDRRYWRWSMPGLCTSVQILGWLTLPWNDHWGEFALGTGLAGPVHAPHQEPP